jgi:hypothetical protein
MFGSASRKDSTASSVAHGGERHNKAFRKGSDTQTFESAMSKVLGVDSRASSQWSESVGAHLRGARLGRPGMNAAIRARINRLRARDVALAMPQPSDSEIEFPALHRGNKEATFSKEGGSAGRSLGRQFHQTKPNPQPLTGRIYALLRVRLPQVSQ